MKFGRLIEYNVSNIFLQKSYTEFDGETSPRPFYEKLKLSISLDKVRHISSLKYYTVVFIVCQVEGYRNILKLKCRLLAFLSY